MRGLALALLVGVLLVSLVFAQDAAAPDADLLLAWKLNVAQADQRVADAQAALVKTPEYQKFELMRKAAEGIKASIARTAQAKTPGYVLDMKAWTWTKAPPQAAAK